MRVYIVKDGMESAPRLVRGGELRIGRAPANDLVLADPTVSGRHAVLFAQGSQAFVRDLGSRNGTFVGAQRVVGQAEVRDGDSVRVGDVTLVVRGTMEWRPRYLIEEVGTAVRHYVRGDRFLFGEGVHANLRITGAEDTSLVFDDDGTIWLSTLSDGREIACGALFTVGDRPFRVMTVGLADPLSHTLMSDSGEDELGEVTPTYVPVEHQYRLVVTLNGVAGPEARLLDAETGAEYLVTAENRAVLLWVLAQRRLEGLQSGGEHATWLSDDDASVGVWGKRGTSDANSLHVLVHRLRKEMKKAGFDPWFIEKRRKAIRLALRDVSVE
jgi:hypothetical protein